jgi:hypothetical protein
MTLSRTSTSEMGNPTELDPVVRYVTCAAGHEFRVVGRDADAHCPICFPNGWEAWRAKREAKAKAASPFCADCGRVEVSGEGRVCGACAVRRSWSPITRGNERRR